MSKAELLFLVVIASVPVQLGKFFFPDYSYVFGIPIDYRVQAVYFSDIAIILYLAFSVKSLVSSSKKQKQLIDFFFKKNPFYLISLTALVAYMVISNLFVSVSKIASLYFSLKR